MRIITIILIRNGRHIFDMIPTVADNLKNYLKYKQLEIKQTQKKKDYICYQGHEYLAHTSGKKAVYLTCRKRCGGRAKLMIGLDLIITIQHSLECQNLVAAITPNANQDLALAPPPLSSVGLAITHQAQVSIAPQTSNANQDLALAPPPLSSVGLAITHQAQVSIAPQTSNANQDLALAPPPLSSVGLAITHQAQVSIAPQTSNANQDLALAPPPLSSVAAITHQAQVSIAPQISNANQDLALAPPPLSSVGLAITHQAQVSIAPQTTSGFARAYQTFISNLGNSGTYQDINVGIESNTDLPLEVAHVLMDLHQNINDPRFVKSQKGKPLLFFQDYLYRQDYQKDNKIHYRCRKVGCKASCKFDVIYITSGLHEHQNEIDIFEKLRTHEVLEDIVAENSLETRHNIYEKAINKRFLETPNINFYLEAMPSFISLKSTIDRLLQKIRPPLPQSVDSIVLLPEYITTNRGDIFLINNDDNNNNKLLVFGTCSMLKLIETCDNDTIYMVGTFYVVPRLYYQLYTIHVLYQETMIPIVYALLPDKTRATYIDLFQIILRCCAENNIIFNPRYGQTRVNKRI
ncbi:uncharacterized protein LOC135931423 isoform X2 [Gordionus sp. m RMFG-2023]|uniref:uncharacterized protein LOC135931423 isoform X2 n=1 Tax=Gordionus sp. m RMFG-2023 TaxID=3053472 RepID=UPI0031FC7667